MGIIYLSDYTDYIEFPKSSPKIKNNVIKTLNW